MAILLALLLAQADDRSAVAERLDAAIRAMAGYNAGLEAKPLGDAEFLKRVTRDLLDVAPIEGELKSFEADLDRAKRAKAVDRLLADPRFDVFWAKRFTREFFGDPAKLRFSELLDRPIGTETLAVDRFEQWLGTRFQKDVPWTDIISDILKARGTLDADPALGYLLSFWRGNGAPAEFGPGVSRHFLGIQLYCAKCHDHPYDRWRVEDYYGMGAFVARQRVELQNGALTLRYADIGEAMLPTLQGKRDANVKMAGGGSVPPTFLFGGTARKADDAMTVLAGFMTSPKNTQLPRALANRVWGWLFGAGILNPVDDFALKHKAASPLLFEILSRDLIDHKYSLKRLVRVICATQSYQMATPEEAPEATSFRHLVGARVANGRYSPLPAKSLSVPLSLDVPAAWTRMKENFGAKALYVVRAKGTAPGTAELTLFEGKKDRVFLESAIGQFVKPKKASDSFDAKGKVTLGEISGSNTCIPGKDGPTDYVVLAAVVEFSATGVFTFRFEGPASIVNEWREEFRALLQSATPR